jgi:hypothetical protein
VTQEIEHLLGKHEALSSNSSPAKKEKVIMMGYNPLNRTRGHNSMLI